MDRADRIGWRSLAIQGIGIAVSAGLIWTIAAPLVELIRIGRATPPGLTTWFGEQVIDLLPALAYGLAALAVYRWALRRAAGAAAPAPLAAIGWSLVLGAGVSVFVSPLLWAYAHGVSGGAVLNPRPETLAIAALGLLLAKGMRPVAEAIPVEPQEPEV